MYDLNLTESLLNNSLHNAHHDAANNMHAHSLTPPNHTSMALGLNSMALRIPFGSPHSMTSPLIESAQQQSYMYSHQQQHRNQQYQHDSMNDDSNNTSSTQHHQALFGRSMSMSTAIKHANGSSGNRSYAQIQTGMMLTAEKSGVGADNLSRINGNLFGNSEDMSRHHHMASSGNNSNNMHTGGGGGISSNLFGLPTPGLTPIPFNNGNNHHHLFHTAGGNTSGISHFNDNSELLDTSRKVDFDISHSAEDEGDVFDHSSQEVKTQVKQRKTNKTNSNNNTVALNKSLDFGDEEDDEEEDRAQYQQTAVRVNSLASNNAPLSAVAFAASSNNTNEVDEPPTGGGAATRRVSFATARLSFSAAANQPYTGLRSGAQRVLVKDRDTLSEEEEDEVNEEEESMQHSQLQYGSSSSQQHTPFTPSANSIQYSLVDTPNSVVNNTNNSQSHRRILEGESPFKLQRKTSSPIPLSLLHNTLNTPSEE
eukprot:gene24963-31363_t